MRGGESSLSLGKMLGDVHNQDYSDGRRAQTMEKMAGQWAALASLSLDSTTRLLLPREFGHLLSSHNGNSSTAKIKFFSLPQST